MGIDRFIRKICVQDAVYWGSPVQTGSGGFTFADPVEIKVRWEEKAELIALADREKYVTKAEILTFLDLDVGGYLYQGLLSNLESNPDQPKEIDGAHRIMRFDKVPMIKSTTEFVRKVFL